VSSDLSIIIPARYQSTRFPGKPLTMLRGASGQTKSLVHRSWDTARTIVASDCIWVATDDRRIADAVEAFGGQVVMTPSECRNGTERCAAALAALGDRVGEVIVNLQGDAPLTPQSVVGPLIQALASDPSACVSTPAVRCSPSLYQHLLDDQAAGRSGGTTVVFDINNDALYFSKRVIPHCPASDVLAHERVFLHLGVYAYRADALRTYSSLAPTVLEEIEGLEQLRFLESGGAMRVVPTDTPEWDCIELNNSSDVPGIEAVLSHRGID
jgi:3-deoxy-manno-octulosonate cytidylyltransferase (CMP-KDO synthetase)